MCGFAAIVGDEVSSSEIWRMVRAMHHRGPDDAGVAVLGHRAGVLQRSPSAEVLIGRIGLGLARLAIIDLTDAGAQPMCNEDGSVWIAYNGEIYNFRALRSELERRGHRFRSHTDTEVLVHGWEEWKDGLLERIEGMFAFCLHDTNEGRTVLGRDRFGVKPLYYARRSDGAFVAASEVKALLVAGIDARLDPDAIAKFLTWLWVPDPDTGFLGISKLPAGHVLDIGRDGAIKVSQFWDYEFEEDGASTDSRAADLRTAVEEAVRRQLVSDVPIGAFFSGGLDSTAVVEVMRRELQPAVPTCYTVGLSERDLAHDVIHDDLEFARAYAKRGDIAYRETILAPDLAQALPKVVWHLEEPIADPAALSAYYIAQSARQELTVMLSGVGGDELFGGYPRYRATALARRFRGLPVPLQRALRGLAQRLPGAGAGKAATIGRNAQKLLAGAHLPFPDDYLSYLTYFDDGARRQTLAPDWQDVVSRSVDERHRVHLESVSGRAWIDQAMYLDLKTFLPNLNLAYMDKMSMAHSLEVRVPLLDERVVDVVRRMNPKEKLSGRTGKPLFRQAMRGLVPDEIISRPKAGFSAPARGWLAHELKPMVQELLAPDVIRDRGIFNPAAVMQLMHEFDTGQRDHALRIWQLLTLELWHRAFIDDPCLRRSVAA